MNASLIPLIARTTVGKDSSYFSVLGRPVVPPLPLLHRAPPQRARNTGKWRRKAFVRSVRVSFLLPSPRTSSLQRPGIGGGGRRRIKRRRGRGGEEVVRAADETASRASTETCLCAWDTYLEGTTAPTFVRVSGHLRLDASLYRVNKKNDPRFVWLMVLGKWGGRFRWTCIERLIRIFEINRFYESRL